MNRKLFIACCLITIIFASFLGGMIFMTSSIAFSGDARDMVLARVFVNSSKNATDFILRCAEVTGYGFSECARLVRGLYDYSYYEGVR